jgi:WD40 repeat protein
VRTISVGSIVYAAAISPNNKLVAAGSFDGITRVYDETTGRQLASLVTVRGEGDRAEWLALTPEGFAAGSDSLVAMARWRMSGQEVNGAPLWPALRRPEQVAKALRGEAVGEVKFEKK